MALSMNSSDTKRPIKIGLIALVYAFIIVVFCFSYYQRVYSQLINEIDRKLIDAVYATRAIIGDDFHDNLQAKGAISYAEDYAIGKKLYEFATTIEVDYLYSLKRFEDNILFVISSATKEEIESGTYTPAYYTEYPEMTEDINQVFETEIAQTIEYTDRWGSFRSTIAPFKTLAGEVYAIGADLSISHVQSAAVKSLLQALLMGLILTALVLPVIYLLMMSIKREWGAKYQLLFKDELTGLPNRNQLIKDLKTCDATNLALIDIKKFADVSNTYGPALSDDILKQFAFRLNNFRDPRLKNYRCYRLGGDVFATLEDSSLGVEAVQDCALKLIGCLVEHSYKISNSEEVRLEVTVGGVNQNEDALMLANMALQEAKEKNQQSFVYDGQSAFLPAVYKNNMAIKNQLLAALDEGRLVPFLQPIFSTKNRALVKYECLARIINANGDIELTPDLFIPVAKRTRLYTQITQQMVAKSIAIAQTGDFTISINLSVSDMMDDKTRLFLYQAVKESKIANRIQFEILENEPIEDIQKVRDFMIKLQQLGAQVGIDDLGRSYSNFDRLTVLPVDFIKIDGSIITSIENNPKAQSLTKEIVALAHRHHIKVTAEYCYNEATTEMATQLGVDYLQGFYLGKPERYWTDC